MTRLLEHERSYRLKSNLLKDFFICHKCMDNWNFVSMKWLGGNFKQILIILCFQYLKFWPRNKFWLLILKPGLFLLSVFLSIFSFVRLSGCFSDCFLNFRNRNNLIYINPDFSRPQPVTINMQIACMLNHQRYILCTVYAPWYIIYIHCKVRQVFVYHWVIWIIANLCCNKEKPTENCIDTVNILLPGPFQIIWTDILLLWYF